MSWWASQREAARAISRDVWNTASSGVHRLAEEVPALLGDFAGVDTDPDPKFLPGMLPVVLGESPLDSHGTRRRTGDTP